MRGDILYSTAFHQAVEGEEMVRIKHLHKPCNLGDWVECLDYAIKKIKEEEKTF